MFHAYAATEPGGKLKPLEYDLGEIGANEVDVKVEYCGICHTDLSMLDNEWGMSAYPLVAGHEVIGTIEAVGDEVQHLQIGQRVGVGWFAQTCMSCEACLGGDQNLCASGQSTMVGRYGGFADQIRVAARHNIEPVVENYPFEQVNEALNKLRNGKPRYRLVLTR